MSYPLPTLKEIHEFVPKNTWVRRRYTDATSLPECMQMRGTVMRRPTYDARLLEAADAIDRGFFHIHFELRAVESQGVLEYRWVLVTPIDMHC